MDTFGWALINLKNGMRVTRRGWRDKSVYVEMQVPDEGSVNTEPYLFMSKQVDGKKVRFPINLSCESIMAEDWELFKEP